MYTSTDLSIGYSSLQPLKRNHRQGHASFAYENDRASGISQVIFRGIYEDLVADFEEILAFNMVVKPHVRGVLIRRELDFASLLEGITVPVLVTHGRSDTAVLPTMADYILNHCKIAEVSWYEGIGHAPFLEEPLRFNTELKRFAVSARH